MPRNGSPSLLGAPRIYCGRRLFTTTPVGALALTSPRLVLDKFLFIEERMSYEQQLEPRLQTAYMAGLNRKSR